MTFRFCLILGSLVALMLASGQAVGGNLPVPAEGAAARAAIIDACPACLAGGVTLCGTADVRFGKAFARHFFAGTPARGQSASAATSASCANSSARSMSRSIRTRPPMSLARSMRKTASIAWCVSAGATPPA